jgi:hypothetical protein
MICLAYYSSATQAFETASLGPVLETSQRNNTRAGVTGLLCHYDGSFLQFLEGEPEAVTETFSRISADPRHRQVLVVYRQPITARAFADWSMSLVDIERLGPAEQAFCTALQEIEIKGDAAHREAIEPFLKSFKSWLR